jgi:hypothetical protein
LLIKIGIAPVIPQKINRYLTAGLIRGGTVVHIRREQL